MFLKFIHLNNICLAFLFVVFSQYGMSQLTWNAQTGPVNFGLMIGVDFIDENTGWIVEKTFTTSGNVLKTIDGGLTWEPNYIPSAQSLSSVSFVSSTIGWVLDYDGQIFKTIDGGSIWVNQYENLTAPWLYSIHFINDQKGWVSGNEYILYTINGGNDWDSILSPVSGSPLDIEFYNQNIGYIASIGSTNNFAKTTDGGQNWSVYTVPFSNIQKISVVGENKVWVVANNGKIAYSDDGGVNWIEKGIGLTSENLYCVDFYDELNGVVGGVDGLILTTSDGGDTWFINDIPSGTPTVTFLDVKMASPDKAWIVGNANGVILTSKAENDLVIESYIGESIVCKNYPFDIKFEIKNHGTSPLNASTFTLVGNDGLLLTYDWTGNLLPGDSTTINIGQIFLSEGQNLICTFDGDYVTSNNYFTFYVDIVSSDGVSVNGPHTVCPFELVELEVFGGISFEWHALSETTSAVTITSGDQDNIYPVTITYNEVYLCELVDTVFVYINPSCNEDITAFSPNGDGINDFFYINGADKISNTVTIFNRWGNVVATFNNYNNLDIVWYGEYDNGVSVTENTYFYVLQSGELNSIDNSSTQVSGWVQVIR